VNAVFEHLAKDEQWIKLLGDLELPASLKRKFHGLFFVRGQGWTPPSDPAVILQITDPKPSEEGGLMMDRGSRPPLDADSMICLRVSSQTNSRTVLDENCAERLLGRGHLAAKLANETSVQPMRA
jgi:hypothetical protein